MPNVKTRARNGHHSNAIPGAAGGRAAAAPLSGRSHLQCRSNATVHHGAKREQKFGSPLIFWWMSKSESIMFSNVSPKNEWNVSLRVCPEGVHAGIQRAAWAFPRLGSLIRLVCRHATVQAFSPPRAPEPLAPVPARRRPLGIPE